MTVSFYSTSFNRCWQLAVMALILTGIPISGHAQWYPITLSKINPKEARVGMNPNYYTSVHPLNTGINWHGPAPYWTTPYVMPAGQAPNAGGAWVTGDSTYNWFYYRGADGKMWAYYPNGSWYNTATSLDANGPIFGSGYGGHFYFSNDDGQRNWLRTRYWTGSVWSSSTVLQLPRGTLAGPATNAYYVYYASLYDRRIHGINYGTGWADSALTSSSLRAVPNAQIAVQTGAYGVYFVAEDGGVYWLAWTGSVWSATLLNPSKNANTSTPGVAYTYAGSIHCVYYKGVNGSLWTTYFSGSAWTAPTEIPTTLLSPASQLTTNPSTGDVFYVGRDNRVRGITATSGRQVADVDADGLPDSEDTGGSNPDRDGDGILDGVEVNLLGPANASPTVASLDNDNDGMLDSFETFYGFSTSNAADAFGDADGDGYPNVFEIRNGSDPTFAGSIPAPAAIADLHMGADSTTDNIYATIADAISAARTAAPASGGYPVVFVREGVYPENLVIDQNLRICIVGESRLAHPTIEGQGDAPAINILNGQVCISGLTISHGGLVPQTAYPSARGISVQIPSGYTAPTHVGTSRIVRFTNLILCDHRGDTGAGILLRNAIATVAHCTVFDNYAYTSAGGIRAEDASTVTLVNSILWNKPPLLCLSYPIGGAPDTGQTSVSGGATLTGVTQGTPQNCIIHASGVADPLLDPFGGLRQGSPAINAGVVLTNMPITDVNGEPRNLITSIANPSTLPDIGADEFVDVDADGMPDSFEYRSYGSLLIDSLTTDTDGDGLSDAYELLLGTDPFKRDSDGDGLWDGIEIEYGLNPLDPNDVDPDHDGISVIDEFRFNANPNANDSAVPANRDSFLHDLRSRLTDYSRAGGGGAGSFTLDVESNIVSASER